MNITDFLQDSTRGVEKRTKLFHEIGKYIYEVLYKDLKACEEFDEVVNQYFNQLSFFADDYYDLKNMLYFAHDEPKFYAKQLDARSIEAYLRIAKGIIAGNVSTWLDKTGIETLNATEMHILYGLQ